MQGLQKFLVALVGAGILATLFSPVANAAAGSATTDNGTIAAAIEAKINEFKRSNLVGDLGYSIYQEGRVTVAGAESVSTSPDEDFVNKHLSVHCSTSLNSENNQYLKCTPPDDSSLTAEDKKMLELGDINFATLLGADEYTQARTLAAQNIIRNITNPFPIVKFKKALTSETPMNGTQRKDYAKYLASQAVLGVAMNSFETMYAMRVPGSDLGVTGTGKDSSLMSMMADESSKRFEGNDDFAALLASDPTDPKTQAKLLKELVTMESFKLWMDFQRFKQNERLEALLAASLAKYVSSSYATESVMSSMPKK